MGHQGSEASECPEQKVYGNVTSQEGPTNWSADRQREKKDMSGIHVWLILANPDRGNVFGSS